MGARPKGFQVDRVLVGFVFAAKVSTAGAWPGPATAPVGLPGHAHSTPGPPPAVGGRRGWGSGAACRVPGARRGPGDALWAAALPEALSAWSRPHPRKAAGSAWTPGPVQPDLRVALFCDRPRHLPLPSDLQRCAERFEISASRHRAPSICLWGVASIGGGKHRGPVCPGVGTRPRICPGPPYAEPHAALPSRGHLGRKALWGPALPSLPLRTRAS